MYDVCCMLLYLFRIRGCPRRRHQSCRAKCVYYSISYGSAPPQCAGPSGPSVLAASYSPTATPTSAMYCRLSSARSGGRRNNVTISIRSNAALLAE